MGSLILLLLWVGGAFLVAKIAQSKGKSFGVWLFLAICLDPIVAGLLLSQV
jgi:hypothetical protein